MASVEITRQQTVAYTQHGDTVRRDEAFMKFLVEFRRDGSLRRLKGAPLSLFILLGLHEAEILIRDAAPLTVSDMEMETGYSRPIVTKSLDLLVATNYVQELDARGTRNEKQYRVKSYMWFGAQRSNPKPQTESKKFLLSSQPKNFSPHVHDDVLKHEHQAEKTSSIHVHAQIEKIFSTVFEGVNVQRLAARVDSTELAQEWADWIQDPATRKQYRNPQGFSYTALMAQKNARPTFVYRKEEHTFRPGGISGKLAATILEKCAAADHEDESE